MRLGGNREGFTLVELLVVVALLGIISAVALPALTGYYSEACLKSVLYEIAATMREGKQLALDNLDHGLIFDTVNGKVSLVAKGGDDLWNSPDDRLIHSFRLSDKGGGISFGYGACGPIPGLAEADDGVSFQYNRMVCNERLTGSAGAVYLTAHGTFMAIVMNSEDFSYTLLKWKGGGWEKL